MCKRKFAITILDYSKINNIIDIITEYANISMQSSSHIYFDTQPIDTDEIAEDLIFFQIESENEKKLNKKLNNLIDELDNLNSDYAIRDEDSGEMIVYVKFVGALDIHFDNIEIIKKGTYKKIDELKSYKSSLGVCKGYKPNFRPMEDQPIGEKTVKKESIYLLCHSQEDLSALKEELYKKVLEIDSDFELDFRQFTGEAPEFSTKI